MTDAAVATAVADWRKQQDLTRTYPGKFNNKLQCQRKKGGEDKTKLLKEFGSHLINEEDFASMTYKKDTYFLA